jgi:hypothetical protein
MQSNYYYYYYYYLSRALLDKLSYSLVRYNYTVSVKSLLSYHRKLLPPAFLGKKPIRYLHYIHQFAVNPTYFGLVGLLT